MIWNLLDIDSFNDTEGVRQRRQNVLEFNDCNSHSDKMQKRSGQHEDLREQNKTVLFVCTFQTTQANPFSMCAYLKPL